MKQKNDTTAAIVTFSIGAALLIGLFAFMACHIK